MSTVTLEYAIAVLVVLGFTAWAALSLKNANDDLRAAARRLVEIRSDLVAVNHHIHRHMGTLYGARVRRFTADVRLSEIREADQ